MPRTDPRIPGVVYLSDTGANKADTKHGRIYKLTYDPAHPRRARSRSCSTATPATTS